MRGSAVSPGARLQDRLGTLPRLSSAEFRAEWGRVTASPVPRVSPSLLRLALAWELQARMQGGLSRASQVELDQLARGQTRTAVPRPGTRLVRAWAGRAHVVTIGEDGAIRWDGRSWNSLSEVARAITGTRWSGPAFFGLKQRTAA